MIIDAHAFVVCDSEVYARKSYLLGERGWSAGGVGSRGALNVPDARIIAADVKKTIEAMDSIGTHMQLIGPRPYQMMPALAPAHVTRAWTTYYNDVIAAQVAAAAGRLAGIAALPQVRGAPISDCFEEIERRAAAGFVGVQLNPDPGEGDGTTPGLGERYWYPLYEKLVEYDLPAIVSSGPVGGTREGYSSHYINEASVAILSILENVDFFRDFPTLRLVIGYGGGSVPYQVGRWRARRGRKPDLEDFDTALRRLYFDTLVYSDDAMAMLLKVCGTERCLFATHHPGTGTTLNPATGRLFGDVKTMLETLPGLSQEDRHRIFEGNARAVFSHLEIAPAAAENSG